MKIDTTYGKPVNPLAMCFETDVVGPKAHVTMELSVCFVPYGLTDDGGPAGHDANVAVHWSMVTVCGPETEPSNLEEFYSLTGFTQETFGPVALRAYYDYLSDMADSPD